MTRNKINTYNYPVHRLLELIVRCIDEKRAHDFVSEISRFHRMRGSKDYDNALLFVKSKLDRANIANKVLEFPLDGKTKYWTWEMPKAWEAQNAVLRLPNGQVMCDYREQPMCLIPGSSSAQGSFKLVDVGGGMEPEDYKSRDIKGKIVLSRAYPTGVNYYAVKQGQAAGVIFNYIPAPNPDIGRTPQDMADAIFYPGVYPNFGVDSFAFSVSHNQFQQLTELARKQGEVHVEVQAKNFEGTGKVLLAHIPGQTPEGVIIISHLCHPKPGANDNASGAGLTLEVALVLQELIRKNLVQRPYKSIYFAWVPEMFGTVAMVHNDPDLTARLFTGLNLDMVGEDQDLSLGPMIIEGNPWSTPCFLTKLIKSVLKELTGSRLVEVPEGWSIKYQQFKGGSDHYILSDPTIGIPTTMIGHWPDRFYHSSYDTPDKVSPKSLKIAGASAIASVWLTCWEHEYQDWVVQELVETAREDILTEKASGAEAERIGLLWAVRREGALSYAITRKEPYQVVADVDAGFRQLMQEQKVPEIFFTVGGPVYRRKFRAPLYLRGLFMTEPERYLEIVRSITAHKNYIQGLTEMIFLINGRRSHNEILEFLRWEYPDVADIDYSRIFIALAENGLIE